MAITYERKKQRQNNILYTVVAAILICAVFLAMVTSFYFEAEDKAYEMLHIQTKQIKDDLTLQLKSDKENLVTSSRTVSSSIRISSVTISVTTWMSSFMRN